MVVAIGKKSLNEKLFIVNKIVAQTKVRKTANEALKTWDITSDLNLGFKQKRN